MTKKKNTMAERIIAFNTSVRLTSPLPSGVSVMNPFKESGQALAISSAFYRKYYSDNHKRHLILGINPGRLGAGITGIPFTDTKRLEQYCDMTFNNIQSHELSSVFIYDLISTFGGPKKFYDRYYINSTSPLGFTIKKPSGKEVNYNYYDDRNLQDSLLDFIVWNIQTQINLGCHTNKCFVLGSNKNYKFLDKLNKQHHFFESIIPLEHPRYIMQYKSKDKEAYIEKFMSLLHTK